MLLDWLQLIAGGALIIGAGVKLTRYADVFSEKLGLGQAFVGMVFLGWVTSLPEMVMSVTAVLLPAEDSINLAVGNIMGSCYFNVFMLALMIMIIRKGEIASKVDPQQMLTAAFAMMMMLLAVLGLMLSDPSCKLAEMAMVKDPFGLMVSLFSILILILYVYATWLIYRQDRKIAMQWEPEDGKPEEPQYADWSIGMTALKSIAGMVVIVAGGVWVAVIADDIATQTGLSKSFMGTLFLAVISSLPELTTTISAGRMGRYTMAVGNIFGSNIFNIMILGVCDLFYRKAPLFADLKLDRTNHAIMGAMSIFLSLVFLAGVLYRSERSPVKASWTAIAIAVLYAIGLVVFYFISKTVG